VIDYYARVADAMLPHLRDRPLTLRRFRGRWQASDVVLREELPEAPPGMGQTTPIYVDRRAGEIDFCMCQTSPH